MVDDDSVSLESLPSEPDDTFTKSAKVDDNSDETGTLSKVKYLYEGPSKCKCCINWCEDPPTDLRESIEEQSESKKHALLVRMKKNHSEGKPLVLDSIVVQSAGLRRLLHEVFGRYSGITAKLKKLVFKPPFHPFFFEWQSFNHLCESFPEIEAREHANLLRGLLATELEEAFTVSEDLTRNGVITYDYLWTIFRAGIDIYTTSNEQPCFFKLVNADYTVDQDGNPCFALTARNIDFDGRDFGWAPACLTIRPFQGTRPFEALELLPASLHPNLDHFRRKASNRGTIFRKFHQAPYYYAEYHGLAKTRGRNYTVSKSLSIRGCNADRLFFKLDGRIVIDTAAFQLFNEKFQLKSLDSMTFLASLDVSDKSKNHKAPGSERVRSRSRHMYYKVRSSFLGCKIGIT